MKFLLSFAVVAMGWGCICQQVSAASGAKVSVSENGRTYTLDNGLLVAGIDKRSGDLVSLKYHGLELTGSSGHPYGYWSHSPRGMLITNSLTIDPRRNDGKRAEVSVKGVYTGRNGETRSDPFGSTACDIEIRYSLGRGDSGIYTYSIFTHRTNYPATGIGEARFGMKLNPALFNYLTIDQKRRRLMPKPVDWDQGTEMNFKEARRLNTGIYYGQVEHKYDYSAIQFDIPAFGWSSTKQGVGLWFVNPSMEYLSGGATKVELTGHLDNNDGATPTLLNYWRGSHYGGSICAIGQGEAWSKVIGPFLIYCNSGGNPEKMWQEALGKAEKESKAWPYDWVQGVDYPHLKERSTVKGQVVLNDTQAPNLKLKHLLVGLSKADYFAPRDNRSAVVAPGLSPAGGGEDEVSTNVTQHVELLGRADFNSENGPTNSFDATGSNQLGRRMRRVGRGEGLEPRIVDWQNDAKFYQFWARGDESGRFTIPKVRPGTYTLHVIAEGVLGEASKANVTVRGGQNIDLGRLEWKPLRFGHVLWEIGVPNRSAEEFRHGDHYWQWGLYNHYTNDFPNDVHFAIGQSDYRTDWNYAQLPRSSTEGSAWSIAFGMTNAPEGKATLRVGIAGVSLRSGVLVTVNNSGIGKLGPLQDTATIRRDGIRGYWSERNLSFNSALLHRGTNIIQLAIPGGSSTSGIQYDYLRLELDEKKAQVSDQR